MANVEELLIKITAENKELKAKLADSEKSVQKFGGATNKLSSMAVAGYTAMGAAVAAFAMQSYQAYESQEKANKRLMFAVQGNVEAFNALTEQASRLQSETGVDEESIMQVQMLATSANFTTSEVKRLVEASLALSSATGMDMQAAYMQIVKTLNGELGRALKGMGSDFVNLTKAQLQNGAAVDLLIEKHGNLAKESALATEKLSANWGEIKESVGGVLAKVINPLFEDLNKSLRVATNSSVDFGTRLQMIFNPAGAKFIRDQILAQEEYNAKMQAAKDKVSAMADANERARKKLNDTLAAIEAMKKLPDATKKPAEDFATIWEQSMIRIHKAAKAAQDNMPTFGEMFPMDGSVPQLKGKGMPEPKKKENPFEGMQRGAESAAEAAKTLTDRLKDLNDVQESSAMFAQMFMQMTDEGKMSVEEMGKVVWNTSRQIIAAKMAEGIADAVGSALKTVPFPLNIVAAGVAGAGAAALFNRLVPKLATGGMAYGPTQALVGEYAGASTNPEVIAPLDKLKTMIGGGSTQVYGRLYAGDIYLSNKRGARQMERRGAR